MSALEVTLITVGETPSTTNAFDPLNDKVSPGIGNVRFTSLPDISRMVPLFNKSELVLTYPRSLLVSPEETV